MNSQPFNLPGQFFKGNLHTHCTESDGDYSAEEVVKRYRQQGYDFLALSDHFHERFGYPITDTRPYRSNRFTTLTAAELHVGKTMNDEVWHILAVGIPLDFNPPQKDEDIVAISTRAASLGAFIGIVHPAWYGLQPEDARILPFAHAIEIYNHGAEVENDRGDGWGLCDALLNEGHRVFAYATDDAHHMTHDAFGGWIHVKAENLDPESILQGIKSGHFYSSQGPYIHNIQIEDNDVVVDCSPASVVIISGRGSRSTKEMGNGLTRVRFPLARFRDAHFRITVVDDRHRKAWSNPVWLD